MNKICDRLDVHGDKVDRGETDVFEILRNRGTELLNQLMTNVGDGVAHTNPDRS